MGKAILILLLVCAGCVNFAPAASYLDEHVEQLTKELEAVARATPPDSPAAPLIREAHWRASERMKTWTSELRRYHGPLVLDVAEDHLDNSKIVRENRAMDELTQEINDAEALPFSGSGGLSAITAVLGGGLTGTGLLALVAPFVKRKMSELSEKYQKQKRVNRKLYGALDQVKTVNKDAVVAATATDPEMKAGYKENQAELIQAEEDNKAALRSLKWKA
jgi:hypothetical protein